MLAATSDETLQHGAVAILFEPTRFGCMACIAEHQPWWMLVLEARSQIGAAQDSICENPSAFPAGWLCAMPGVMQNVGFCQSGKHCLLLDVTIKPFDMQFLSTGELLDQRSPLSAGFREVIGWICHNQAIQLRPGRRPIGGLGFPGRNQPATRITAPKKLSPITEQLPGETDQARIELQNQVFAGGVLKMFLNRFGEYPSKDLMPQIEDRRMGVVFIAMQIDRGEDGPELVRQVMDCLDGQIGMAG
ncbi:MAG: hypothetical protein UZ16_OP3001002371 [Candidatus Hinthialibacteria bacterium OLB16]|nr:MAG: hypothetical protein UZ16_OP3001002371 [Candidatus Hinthialibacteria bacterium OLB16]